LITGPGYAVTAWMTAAVAIGAVKTGMGARIPELWKFVIDVLFL
jgi:hypothetical protein